MQGDSRGSQTVTRPLRLSVGAGGGFEINYRRRYSNGTSQQGSPCAAPEWLLGGRFSADADPLGLSENRLAPRVTQIVCVFLRYGAVECVPPTPSPPRPPLSPPYHCL